MSITAAESIRARNRANALSQRRGPNDPETIKAKRHASELAAERYIRNLVAKWPPLTPETRRRLAELLAPGAE